MPGETKEQFLGRVREALRRRGEPVALPDDLEVARVVRRMQDPLALFMARVDESGMHAHRVADEAALVDTIIEIMGAAAAGSAVVPDESFAARAKIIQRLKAEGIRLISPDEPDAAFEADFGITGVVAAVAETASLYLVSGDGYRRLASLAVPNHIAVVEARQVVPDLLDWAAAQPTDMPANAVLISGPSKTADIEMTLVQGVHGPGNVHVVILG